MYFDRTESGCEVRRRNSIERPRKSGDRKWDRSSHRVR